MNCGRTSQPFGGYVCEREQSHQGEHRAGNLYGLNVKRFYESYNFLESCLVVFLVAGIAGITGAILGGLIRNALQAMT